jgi:hypothetical protein
MQITSGGHVMSLNPETAPDVTPKAAALRPVRAIHSAPAM